MIGWTILIGVILALLIYALSWYWKRPYLDLPDHLRARHVRVAGEPGTGKTILLALIAARDIARSIPTVVVDLHGNLTDEIINLLLQELPLEEVVDRLYYVSFSPKYERVFGFPLLGHLFPRVCKKVWSYLEQGAPTFDMVCRALLDVLHAARLEDGRPANLRLTESLKFLRDEAWREAVIRSCGRDQVEACQFWTKTYQQARGDTQISLRGSTENKVSPFCTHPMLLACFAQEKPTISWSDLEERRKTLILDLSGVVDEAGQPDEESQKSIAHAFITTLVAHRCNRHPDSCEIPLSLILDEFAVLYRTAGGSDFHTLQVRARNYNIWLTVAMQQVLMIDNPQMTRALFSLNTQIVGRQNEYLSALAVVQNLISYEPEAKRVVNELHHEVPTEQDRRNLVEVQRLPDRVWLVRTKPGGLKRKLSPTVDRFAFRSLVERVKVRSQAVHNFPKVEEVLSERKERIDCFAEERRATRQRSRTWRQPEREVI